MKGIWKLIVLFYNFSVSLKLQSILTPAVKFYEAWLMFERSSLVHRFSLKHALQPSCAQEYYAHTLQHCSLEPLYIAKSPRKPPHKSGKCGTKRTVTRTLVCSIKLRQEGTAPPCSTSAGNWAHQVTWVISTICMCAGWLEKHKDWFSSYKFQPWMNSLIWNLWIMRTGWPYIKIKRKYIFNLED